MATISLGAAKFRRAFNRSRLTQQQIADMLGTDQPNVSRLLAGRVAPYSAALVERLRVFCGATLGDWDKPSKSAPPLRRARGAAA